MNKFSITILPNKIKLYTCSKDEFSIILDYKFYNITKDILCQTFLENEITFYTYIFENDNDNSLTHHVFSKLCSSDQRIYNAIDIHEDVPGIDHIGIIYNISKFFSENNIPILYLNTFGHNIILVSDEHMSNALTILQLIAYL